MIDIKSELEPYKEVSPDFAQLSFSSSFHKVYKKLQKWMHRFPQAIDNTIFNDLFLLYLVATKKFLDHRTSGHLFRVVLSTHLMHKKLLRKATFFPNRRHLHVRWISTALRFPFSSKPVLSCIIGFNTIDKYELFDEENVILALQKHFPELRLVKESSYHHTSQHKNLKFFYFEIEKKDGTFFSLEEKALLKKNMDEKVKNSIQKLSPVMFMGHNEEEIYKNILVLSQEIQTLQDIPQASINLDQQTGEEIVFRVTLVYISPYHHFSLKDCFINCKFISQRLITVRQLDDHSIEAHIFHLHLPRDASLIRSDGSLNFYFARQKISDLIKAAIGEFRDYNGGIIIKQQELLHDFKESFPEIVNRDQNLLETFFYALMPLEKQATLTPKALVNLFENYLENQKQKLSKDTTYSFKTYYNDQQTYLIVHSDNTSLGKTISSFLDEQGSKIPDLAYNIIESKENVFFNSVILNTNELEAEAFINNLRQSLYKWQQKIKDRKTLRIALEFTVVSLDPRIGGDVSSGDILRLLFEGLTRFNSNGDIENALAESIEISSNLQEYTFKIRNCNWNDGSPISAFDFEYAWKKILSPNFKTSFAYLFHPIKNAKEAKEGKVFSDQIGVQAIDDRTLKVILNRPTPYFLQLTSLPIYSPVNRLVDQQHPQWPYQSEKNYPCNGPFQLKINQPSQGFQLIKNPNYWDTNQIILDQITLTLMNPSVALQAFQNKEIDWIGNPFGTWHSSYHPQNSGKENRVVYFSNKNVCWFTFNTQSYPFHNQKLRQAFAYSINRAMLIVDNFHTLNPAFSPLLPHQKGKQQFQYPEFDKDKAQTLFNEALAELGICKEDLPTFNLIYHEKGLLQYLVPILHQQIKDCLGIDFQLKPLPWNSVFNRMSQGQFQTGLILWTSWVDDPIYTLNTFKSSTQELNFVKWEHPKYEQLLDLSDQETNPFQRSRYLVEAEKILVQEMPIIPLFYQPVQALVSKDLYINKALLNRPLDFARSSFKNGEQK